MQNSEIEWISLSKSNAFIVETSQDKAIASESGKAQSTSG